MPTLHWIGKEKVINHHLDIPYHTLNEEYDFNPFNQANPENPSSENKIIHADNLLALKSLLPEYEGRVKCIYIDPPYNTGNEGWVYNDNVSGPRFKKWLGKVVGKEAEDLTRHDKWLCMMYPRLKLLHKLLSEEGAIFISIDDNEQASLKMIMDEIWGAGNFITNAVWRSSDNSNNNSLKFSEDYNHTIVYSKNKIWKPNFINDESKRTHFKNPDNDPRGPWFDGNPVNNPGLRPNLQYDITTPKGKVIKHPPNGWRWSKETIAEKIQSGELRFSEDETRIIRRTYLNEMGGLTPSNLWIDLENTSHTRRAKYELKKIFPETAATSLFDTPKPPKLIEFVLKLATTENSIILDSFAGSGTTAHAVLNLNNQDGGNRKFILIEMEDYAETITAERVKRVIKGYGETGGTGGSFSFYTLGERVLDDEQNLNPNLSVEKIHSYIWYSETHQPYTQQANAAGYLGKYINAGYYFYYQPNEVTTLDDVYLMNVTELCEQYVMYADVCLLSERTMLQHNIIFKKIPRDISKL